MSSLVCVHSSIARSVKVSPILRSQAGNTALHLAATGNHREVAEVLVENEKTERDLQNHVSGV